MLYSIDNDSPSVMSIDKASAQAGETVTVTNLTSSALSWTLDGVSQNDIAANGTATFTMPSENVVVAENVQQTYKINTIGLHGLNVFGWEINYVGELTEGKTVTITAPDSSDYTYSVYKDDGTYNTRVAFSTSNQGITFVMPGFDAVIYIEVYQGGGGSDN